MFWKGFRLFGMPWSIAHQNPLSMEFLRQEYWSGLLFPSPENLTEPGIEPMSFYHLSHQQSLLRLNEYLGCNIHPLDVVSSWSETPENFLYWPCVCVSFLLSVLSPPTTPPCEDAHRSHPGKKEFSAEPHLLVPWSGTSSSQNWEEINFSCLFHWVYFILLWHS